MEKSVLLDANAVATDGAVRGNGVCAERTGLASPDRASFSRAFCRWNCDFATAKSELLLRAGQEEL